MYNEEMPAYRRPSFWIGVAIAFFGLLLWAYPELLSVLVGGFFVVLGGGIIGRVLLRRNGHDVW